MRDLQRQLAVMLARGMLADFVAENRNAPGLIMGHPILDPVAQAFHHDIRVIHKGIQGSAVRPTAFIFERLGQIPVVQSDKRLHPGIQQPIHQPVVIIQALLAHAANAIREDARPGSGEAVSV